MGAPYEIARSWYVWEVLDKDGDLVFCDVSRENCEAWVAAQESEE